MNSSFCLLAIVTGFLSATVAFASPSRDTAILRSPLVRKANVGPETRVHTRTSNALGPTRDETSFILSVSNKQADRKPPSPDSDVTVAHPEPEVGSRHRQSRHRVGRQAVAGAEWRWRRSAVDSEDGLEARLVSGWNKRPRYYRESDASTTRDWRTNMMRVWGKRGASGAAAAGDRPVQTPLWAAGADHIDRFGIY